MKEDFLHYVWKFQKFNASNLLTADGETLAVVHPGSHNHDSGPDFFNAQLEISGQLWAGNLEIHIKSSDWYVHNHQDDPAYDNVILHVVWEHDCEIYRPDGTTIPTLPIKKHVRPETLSNYKNLFARQKKWINCENDFAQIDPFTVENWLERLYFERLQKKEELLLRELDESKNHWESLLFRLLCKNFGLKVNSESFFSIARSLDFSVVKKCAAERHDLEALLMGQAGLLAGEKQEWYFRHLQDQYAYLRHKYSLNAENIIPPKFFRLRPPNFPTIRLAQLASLYASRENLFSQVLEMESMPDFYKLFKVCTSDYWKKHYNFGIASLERQKCITKNLIDLLVINTVLPLKFCYAKKHGKDPTEAILHIASAIPAESNSIVKKYNSLNHIAHNASHSQALLQLKSEYCDKNKCLQCAIGNAIIGKADKAVASQTFQA